MPINSKPSPQITKTLKRLPTLPGVYFFKNKNREIIYVGKAKNLKKRVLQYWQKTIYDPRLYSLIKNTEKIEWESVNSEIEALLLESEYIKKIKPKYNIKLKDDKNYLLIKITKEEWPKISTTRLKDDPNALYFGRFTSAEDTKETLKILRDIYPYCTSLKIPGTNPCFYWHIGKCPGPCGGKINSRDYRKIIKKIITFLQGNEKVIIRELRQKMIKASENQEFEKAAKLRNQLNSTTKIILHHKKPLKRKPLALKPSDIKKELGLKKIPQRIEAYDVSNIGGYLAVASLAVFSIADESNQKNLHYHPQKSSYRKFKIKTIKQSNDPAMLKEALDRRMSNDWPLPGLIIIDGGKAQLNAVKQVLDKYKITIPVIGSAKGKKELHLSNPKKILNLYSLNEDLRLLIMKLQDEAHRFAISFYKKRHRQSLLTSKLDEIPGIGPKTKTALLRHFGSIEKIKKVPLNELKKIIGKNKSEIIKKNLFF